MNYGYGMQQYVIHCMGKLIRIVEGREIAHGRGIEDNNVGTNSGFENSAVGKAQTLGWQGGHLADSVFERQNFFFANIFAQYARKGSIGARVRMLLAKNALGRSSRRVVVDGDPGLL